MPHATSTLPNLTCPTMPSANPSANQHLSQPVTWRCPGPSSPSILPTQQNRPVQLQLPVQRIDLGPGYMGDFLVLKKGERLWKTSASSMLISINILFQNSLRYELASSRSGRELNQLLLIGKGVLPYGGSIGNVVMYHMYPGNWLGPGYPGSGAPHGPARSPDSYGHLVISAARRLGWLRSLRRRLGSHLFIISYIESM